VLNIIIVIKSRNLFWRDIWKGCPVRRCRQPPTFSFRSRTTSHTMCIISCI